MTHDPCCCSPSFSPRRCCHTTIKKKVPSWPFRYCCHQEYQFRVGFCLPHSFQIRCCFRWWSSDCSCAIMKNINLQLGTNWQHRQKRASLTNLNQPSNLRRRQQPQQNPISKDCPDLFRRTGGRDLPRKKHPWKWNGPVDMLFDKKLVRFTPPKLTWRWLESSNHEWRCMSYWKCWIFRLVMLVCRGCIYSYIGGQRLLRLLIRGHKSNDPTNPRNDWIYIVKQNVSRFPDYLVTHKKLVSRGIFDMMRSGWIGPLGGHLHG